MKCIVITFLFIFSGVGRAEPVALAGTYEFYDSVTPLQMLDIQIVHPISNAERTRLANLRSSGYSCVGGNSTVRCSKTSALSDVSLEHRDELERHWGGTRIRFADTAQLPALIEDNSIYRRWRVSSAVRVSGDDFSDYTLFAYQNPDRGYLKLNIADQWFLYYFPSESYLRMLAEVRRNSASGYALYSYELNFQKQ